MNRIKRFTALLLLFLATALTAMAQEFTASLSQNTVSVGEQFQLTYTLNSNGGRFQPPSLNDFYVLSGPNQSSSMQFVNGSMSQSISLSYILQPKAEGTFKIGPGYIETNGKKLQSNSLTVKVVKGAAKAQNQAQGGNDPAADTKAQIGNNLYLKVSADRSSVYQGEQVVVTYKIYTRLNLVNYSLDKMPSLAGFWSQDIELPKQLEFHKETVDGVVFSVGEIKKVVLFPQRSGELNLEPMEGQCVARIQAQRKRQSNDIFDQLFNDPFFGGGVQDVPYKLKSNALKITVKALPGNTPESFSGAVGKFSMEAFLDKPKTKANDPVSLKIKISGKGNLKLIDPPKISFPQDIETYDPKTIDNISVSANGVSGSRTFEYLLIPRHSGQYKIGTFNFSYFDLEKKEFVNIPSPDFKLDVDKGAEGSRTQTVSGVSKEDVQLLGKDIRFIKIGTLKLQEKDDFLLGSPLFYLLILLPLLLAISFIILYRKNLEFNKNTSLVKKKRATKLARKRLAVAQAFLKENKKSEFYEEIYKAVWGYVSDKLNIPVSHLSKDSAATALRNLQVPEESITEFLKTIGNAEYARFAPAGNAEMEHVYQNTITLITQLEQKIKQ